MSEHYMLASSYAIALRNRTLRLPWNFLLPVGREPEAQVADHWCSAVYVCYSMLYAAGEIIHGVPVVSSGSCIEDGHCFYCKTRFHGSRGLVESCSNCHQEQSQLPEATRLLYFRCFENTLRFSRYTWKLHSVEHKIVPAITTQSTQPIQHTLPTLTKAQAMQLAAKKKLGLPTS